VKKAAAYILFGLLGLVISVPPGAVVYADASSAQHTAQRDAKKSQKQYMKQQKKAEKKATKNWKKQHPIAH
jgi:hypothetical protein